MKTKKFKKTIQDKGENFRNDAGKLFLVRCYAHDKKDGRENSGVAVASGTCAWCGWSEKKK